MEEGKKEGRRTLEDVDMGDVELHLALLVGAANALEGIDDDRSEDVLCTRGKRGNGGLRRRMIEEGRRNTVVANDLGGHGGLSDVEERVGRERVDGNRELLLHVLDGLLGSKAVAGHDGRGVDLLLDQGLGLLQRGSQIRKIGKGNGRGEDLEELSSKNNNSGRAITNLQMLRKIKWRMRKRRKKEEEGGGVEDQTSLSWSWARSTRTLAAGCSMSSWPRMVAPSLVMIASPNNELE